MPHSTTPACLMKGSLKDVKDYLILQRAELRKAIAAKPARLTATQLEKVKLEVESELGAAMKSVEDLESIQGQIDRYWDAIKVGKWKQ